ncbi:Tetratricopeptide repeat protein 27 [Nosema granulosis]|uniref:Tetratricopeptide repeat protein 27 n=1 Tax=Nosema granulosis TaxID=83296 RepID=A0A9P6H475_9MICR|nr:Tetratricopeptide repeat protein 27 [Nosema granulosis]
MTARLMFMLNKNIYESLPTVCKSGDNKAGTFVIDMEKNCDEMTVARYKYITNICSEKPVPFFIPTQVSFLERCCMMFSFDDYSLLEKVPFSHEIVGACTAVTEEQVLYVYIKDCESKEKFKYETRGMSFKDVYVQPLTVSEQTILCLYMIKTYKETKCEVLRRLKVQAYLDRLFFSMNETNFFIWRVLEFYNSLINIKYRELEIIRTKTFFLDPNVVFNIPIILRRDIDVQLANVYHSYGYYNKALTLYSFYLCYDMEIDCLIRMRKDNEAVSKIQVQMLKISKTYTFNQRAQYADYCMKLAKLLDDEKYYEAAFEAYKSYEPLYSKAIHFFKKKDYEKSLTELQRALKLAPENENILYSYACNLTELKRYQEAITVYEKLIDKNKSRTEYHKNIALCYFFLENLEKCMEKLKRAAVFDPNSMELYFKLALTHNKKDELLWCFTKLDYVEATKDKIDLVLNDNIVDKESLIASVSANPKLRNYLKELF